MMMKRGGGALTEQSTRPLCPWLPLGTGFGVPPRWGRGGERVRVSDTYPGAPCIYVPQTAPTVHASQRI